MTATITVQTLLDWPTQPPAANPPREVNAADQEETDYLAAVARVAALTARPNVTAIIDRYRQLAPAERRALGDACRRMFAMHRLAYIAVKHRVRRDYGPNWADLSSVNSWVWNQVDEQDHYGFVVDAVEDAVYAVLVADLLSEDERRLFDGPWRDCVRPVA